MKINAGEIFGCFLLLECVIGSSAVPSGTVVLRKPAVIDKATPTPTPTTKSSPIKTTKVEESMPEAEDLPTTTSAIHEESHQKSETTPTAPNPTASADPSASADPTDYSTIWPTRWRPRRRLNFGAEGDAGKPRVAPDRLLISLVIIGSFIMGILL